MRFRPGPISLPTVAAAELPASTQLSAVDGQTRSIDEWLITFQLLGVVLDPFTYESSWLLETAGEILSNFAGASVRTCFVVTGTAEEARQFCGPWVERVLIFADPDRTFVRDADLEALPALFHLRQNREFGGIAQGWQPQEWRAIAQLVAKERHWSSPIIPGPGMPAAYPGTPALDATV